MNYLKRFIAVDHQNDVLKQLITSEGSLTQILKSSCHVFKVQRLSEKIVKIKHQTFWERQVILFCDDQPVVFAISSLPFKKLKTSKWRKLKILKNQPLGELLFKIKPMRRTAFKFFKINQYWSRESIFHNDLSVVEIFLSH